MIYCLVLLLVPLDPRAECETLLCFVCVQVLFQNDSPATLLARVIGIISPIDQKMLAKGKDTYKYFTKNHMLYERNQVKDTCTLQCCIPFITPILGGFMSI